MQRRSFIKNTALTLGALALLNKSSLAAFPADPAYNIKMLTDNIGIFTERGGTILFMLGKKGIVVVDAQFPDTAQHCIDELKKKSSRPLSLLINTHHHGDHTAGNLAFKGLAEKVLAHENSKINQQAAAVKNKNEEKQLYPDATYSTKWTKKLSKERVTLHYMGRGHTNGDSFVHFEKANIIHTGDLVFNRRHPFVDRSAGANIKEWILVLNKATSFFTENATYVSGHAATGYPLVINKADVLAFRDYLENVLKYTAESISKGMTKAEFLQATEIPGSPEWKGDGITRPLEAAWEELHEK
ncbi:MAG: MBL fold metallo-hydrolase [Ferruginibacter sp.]